MSSAVPGVKEMKFRADQPMVNCLLKALEIQDREVGDGSTRMLILIEALLEGADRLIRVGLHPRLIAEGFGEAASDTGAFIGRTSSRVEGIDDLVRVAETALAGKTVGSLQPTLAQELTRGIVRISDKSTWGEASRRDAVAYELLEASLPRHQSILNGVLLHARRGHPSAPARLVNAKVALIDYPLDVFNKPAYASRIPHGKVESEANVGEQNKFSRKSRELLELLISSIVASGAKVVICKRGMGNLAMSMLARHGIFPVEKVTREIDIRRLIYATGGKLVGNPSTLASRDLGKVALVEEVAMPSGHITLIDGGSSSGVITVIISGVSAEAREAGKRGIETTVGAIDSAIGCRRVVAGGGAVEAAASRYLHELSYSYKEKKQLVYQEFAEALMSIPRNLAETTGLRSYDLLSELKSSPTSRPGIDVGGKAICDTYIKGIVDPLRVVSCYISNATDFASLVLSVDMLLTKPPKKRG